MLNSQISKKKYIESAYQLLASEGIEAVTIRRLAGIIDCNTANLYRYFSGVDELVAYASLGYLQGYLAEVYEHMGKNENSLELHFTIWDCFSRYSFANPEVFNNLFFGKASGELDAIIKEYYTIFPNELVGMDDYYRNVFYTGDFNYRDYLLISRCVEDGYLREEDAKLLNGVCINMYKGYLKTLLDHREPKAVEHLLQTEFLQNLKQITLKYKLPEREGMASRVR